MLTEQHLSVIRAALLFWDEEMSPHDPAIAAPYLDQPVGSGDWIKETVALLRQQFAVCRLRYVVCSWDGMSLQNDQIFGSLPNAQMAATGSATVATLILLGGDSPSSA